MLRSSTPNRMETRRSSMSRPSPSRPPLTHLSNIDTSGADDLVNMMDGKLNIHTPNNMMTPNAAAAYAVDSETIDWKKECKEMDKMFEQQTKEQLKGLPRFKRPEQLKRGVRLYKYQQDGVRWLIHQERNPAANPFVNSAVVKDGSTHFYDKLMNGRRIHDGPYTPTKGSILADDMGLGKTIQTLALVATNPPSSMPFSNPNSPIATLIVCPKSVISNWLEQIDQFFNPDALQVVVYEGTRKQRSKMIPRVQDNEVDIVLASYETLASECGDPWDDFRGNHMPDIFDCSFHRLVIDEGHIIRSVNSKAFKAIMAVAYTSEHRLALTGTPFVNKPEDIHALLAFIGLKPLEDKQAFKWCISDPISERKRVGLTRLRTALAYTALRRTKNGVNNHDIEEKTVHQIAIPFPEGDHKEIHNVLYTTARAVIRSSIKDKQQQQQHGIDVNKAVFEMVLRIRQSCASGKLVPTDRIEHAAAAMVTFEDENGKMKHLTATDRADLIDMLQLDEFSCKKAGGASYLGPSPKILALLETIKGMAKDEKGIIFSQWTEFLNLIEPALVKAGHRVCRIDGSMDTASRTLAMQRFANDDSVRFILCSLKAAGTGINLTRGNVVFMMEPWWNDAVETQAIDRCHRLGQTRPVRVYRLVMKDSIEERLIAVQKAKAALGKGSMEKLSQDEEKMAKIMHLKDLFDIKSGDDAVAGKEMVEDDAWTY